MINIGLYIFRSRPGHSYSPAARGRKERRRESFPQGQFSPPVWRINRVKPMRSLTTFLAAIATLGVAALVSAAPASASAPSVYVDGRQVVTDVPAIGDGGRMFVPLRVIEQLGAHVDFDANAGVADILWRGVEAKVYSGSPIA